jgi:replicative DNA helicase
MNAIAPKLPDALPFSMEAEQALLATVMTFNQVYAGVAAIVGPDDFYDPLHARIFEAIQKQIGEGKRCTALTLLSEFREDETIRGLNMEPSAFFARLARLQEPPGSAIFLAHMVKDDATRRMIILSAEDFIARARKPEKGDTAMDMAAEALETVSQIAALAQGAAQQSCFRLADAADAVTTAVNDRFQHGVVPDNMAFPGSHTLARVIGGWKRKKLYVLGGRPSMGKTTVGLSWLLRTAMKGHGVAFFSLEMEAEELTTRALTDLAWTRDMRIEYDHIDRGELEAWQVERICQAQQKLEQWPLFIDHRVGLTLAQVRARTQQLAQQLQSEGKRLDVVAIDHMGLLRASDRYSGNKVAETEEVSAGLKAIAKEMDVAVVALVQLNRALEGRDNKRPGMTDLRWSGAIEQDADCVMFCYREAYYLEREKHNSAEDEMARESRLDQVRNVLEIAVAKQRGGKTPVLEFFTDIGCGVVRDLEGR